VGRYSSASRLLGLNGFEVLAAQVVAGEWQLEIQTTATVVGCQGCGVRAEFLAFHATDGCSNGPTEAVNLLIKR
jgi:hypothetical protein